MDSQVQIIAPFHQAHAVESQYHAPMPFDGGQRHSLNFCIGTITTCSIRVENPDAEHGILDLIVRNVSHFHLQRLARFDHMPLSVEVIQYPHRCEYHLPAPPALFHCTIGPAANNSLLGNNFVRVLIRFLWCHGKRWLFFLRFTLRSVIAIVGFCRGLLRSFFS